MKESLKVPITTMRKVDTLGKIDILDPGNHMIRDLTGVEEVPTLRHERTCSECGQVGDESGRSSLNIGETELMRSCTQILEIHCLHNLKAH
uniref:Uncharacterized protein n=1 Tax=Physcomitrium patens TaxID=3218 RepID=A0A2K1J1C1_PHYPA|nr:hypothetical protein PHYPA_023216 [Physcomitrium patens]